ncbi:DUF4372 domain-containing protein [uncultured Bacteroides sp.]|nr:DUF4372 domain-containing protein [uncultured Bacteroides sp.]
MGKSINFTGQPVLSQLLKFIDKQKILDLSQKMGCERYVKSFDGYTHLVVMLFGVLKHFDSLRELEIGMFAEANKLQHLGIDYIWLGVVLWQKQIKDGLRSFLPTSILCCWNNMGLF